MKRSGIVVRVGERELQFEPDAVVYIGREDDNDVVCDNRNVSRRHAELRHDGAAWVVTDLHSTQGMYVDGRPVASHVVRVACEVVLGIPGRGETIALEPEQPYADTATIVPGASTLMSLTRRGTWAPAEHVPAAMHAIVFTDICGSVAQTQQLGDDGHVKLLDEHDRIVRDALATLGGREIKHTGDGVMASFRSVTSAVDFAIAVQRSLAARNADADVPLLVSVGVSAGEPVTGADDDLFGAAVQLAARLCAAAAAGEVLTSLAVRELCLGKRFRFEDRGELALKGMDQPTRAFRVVDATSEAANTGE